MAMTVIVACIIHMMVTNNFFEIHACNVLKITVKCMCMMHYRQLFSLVPWQPRGSAHKLISLEKL